MAEPSFWDDQENARGVIEQVNALKRWTEPLGELTRRLNDLGELLELADESENGLIEELALDAEKIEKRLDELEMLHMLSGRDDHRNALLTIHPGAGGTESQDWAQMLSRMYTRWLDNRGFRHSVLDFLPGEEAGIKSMTIEVQGEYAFGYLKAEKGIHRLVRISPFDANSRRHTSFASVFVYPEIESDVEVNIEEKDLRIDTFRASGAGGQHVNKTDSAVRITHIPSGIVVVSQLKSQHQNRAQAMLMLKTKLYDAERARQDAERSAERKGQIGSGDRSERIRTYNFPQGRITDHRINLTLYNLAEVIEGALDPVLDALAAEEQAQKLAAMEQEA